MTAKKLVALTTVDKDLIYEHVESYEMQGNIPFNADGEDEYNLTIKKLIDKLVSSIFIKNRSILDPIMFNFARNLVLEHLYCNFREMICSSIYSDSKSKKENKMYVSLTLFIK
jgi:hypothetical protein